MNRLVLFCLTASTALIFAACSRAPAPDAKPAAKAAAPAAAAPMPTASEVESAYRATLDEAAKDLGIKSEVTGFTLQSCVPAGNNVRCEASMTMTVNGETQSGTHTLTLARKDGGFVLVTLPGLQSKPTNAIKVIQK
jgi:hypothetical protein